MTRRRDVLAAALALAVAPRVSADASFPSRALKLMVGQAPGGQTDTIARALAQRWTERFSVPVVVENQGGASGTIAARAVAQAAPDGYTLLVGSTANLVFAPALQASTPYDTLRDFAPVGRIARVTYALFVRATLPAASVADLVALARVRPGAVTMATVGSASSVAMIAGAFARSAGVDFLPVPFKGSALGVQAMVAGDVDATFIDLSTAAPHLAQGTLRALALVGDERSPLAPGVPTLRESGYAGVGDDPWYALVAPVRTPAPVIDALSSMLREAVRDDALQRRFAALGIATFDDTPAAFARALGADVARVRASRTVASSP